MEAELQKPAAVELDPDAVEVTRSRSEITPLTLIFSVAIILCILTAAALYPRSPWSTLIWAWPLGLLLGWLCVSLLFSPLDIKFVGDRVELDYAVRSRRARKGSIHWRLWNWGVFGGLGVISTDVPSEGELCILTRSQIRFLTMAELRASSRN
jgi:hypothetical protein